jgi:predicted SAM-dependent methyltransferase
MAMDFAHTRLALNRPIRSYAKIQRIYSALVRNRGFQAARASVRRKDLLNIGCGDRINPAFVNIDYSWIPGVDLCWDVGKPLPFADSSIAGVFTEHCLEHLSFDAARGFISEVYRILRPGGVARIIVPDAELFLRAYCAHNTDQSVQFPPPYSQRLRDGGVTPVSLVNSIFRDFGHLYAYDYVELRNLLARSPFSTIYRSGFMNSAQASLLIDTPERRHESLYVEALK